MGIEGVGEAIDNYIKVTLFLMLFVPLGIWKFVEIIIWCFKHIHIG